MIDDLLYLKYIIMGQICIYDNVTCAIKPTIFAV